PGGADSRERELIYRALLELRMEMREVKAILRHLAGSPRPDAAPEPESAPTFAATSFEPPLADELDAPYPEPAFSDADYEIEDETEEETEDDFAGLAEGDGFEPDAADAEFEVEEDEIEKDEIEKDEIEKDEI